MDRLNFVPLQENLLECADWGQGSGSVIWDGVNRFCSSIDSLLPKIQENLLETISYVLAKTPYRAVKGVTVRSGSSSSLQAVPDIPSPALTQLALRTLTEFNLKVRGGSLV